MQLVVTSPFGCSYKDIPHGTDEKKELHGTLEAPIPVKETRVRKYVAWEYEEIGRVMGLYHRCQQQLFEDREKKPRVSVDRIVVRDLQGKHHVFYFDISVPINEDLVEMEKAWADHQAGKPIDPRRRALLDKAIDMQKKNSRIVDISDLTQR